MDIYNSLLLLNSLYVVNRNLIYTLTYQIKILDIFKRLLKYGFCKKSLRKNETLTSCPFFHFFYHFWVGATANPTKSDKKK